jgi:hypothetical protein
MWLSLKISAVPHEQATVVASATELCYTLPVRPLTLLLMPQSAAVSN